MNYNDIKVGKIVWFKSPLSHHGFICQIDKDPNMGNYYLQVSPFANPNDKIWFAFKERGYDWDTLDG